jgi:hypothetical protein
LHGFSVLEDKKFEIIGLETGAAMPKNIGLYVKSGFKSITPTIIFNKEISEQEIEGGTEQFLEFAPGKSQIKSVSELVRPGLDYSRELREENILSVLFNDGVSKGRALIRPEGEGEFYVKTLLISKPKELSLSRFLTSLEKLAQRRGVSTIKIPANTANEEIESSLVGNNYQVERLATRMIFKGNYKPQAGFDLSRWAM